MGLEANAIRSDLVKRSMNLRYDIDQLTRDINPDILRAQSDQIRKHIESIPVNFRLRSVRAFKGELSATQTLRLKCAECVGFEDVRPRVSTCKSWRCPIWNLRPYQNDEQETEDDGR